MGKLRAIVFVTAISVLSAIAVPPLARSSPAHVYYIDFDNGSDNASGVSQTSAWKHAPGDPQATNLPSRLSLSPGDTVLFKAGVIYRGSIQVKANGAEGFPITFSGQGWGAGRAILSGRDPVEAGPQPCRQSPICASLPNADQLVVFDLGTPVNTYNQIVLDGHVLTLSQSPKPSQPGFFDDIGTYASVPQSDLEQVADANTWKIKNDIIHKSLGDSPAGDLLVLMWGYPGIVTSNLATGYDPGASSVQFRSDNFKRGPHDEVQFSLANHPRFITLPYEYATVEHGSKIVVRAPSSSSKVEISRRAWCFSAVNQKYIAIRGFTIVGFSDGPKGGGGSALAVRGVENISFSGNDVHDLDNWGGGGAVSGEPVAAFDISNNLFSNFPHGSGIRIGQGTNIQISKNEFSNIGRTGIMLMNSQRALIDHNMLNHLYGSHGNGISIYRDNRDVVVSNNLIAEATRAVTFEGANRSQTDQQNNIKFVANLIKGDGGSGLQSWGANTNGVYIERNIILLDNAEQALRLSGRDRNVAIRQNIIDGYQASPMQLPPDTILKDNIFVSNSRGSTKDNEEDSGYRMLANALFEKSSTPDSKICTFLSKGAPTGSGIGPLDLCRAP